MYKIEKLHPDHAWEIIDKKKPKGLFYVEEDGVYTGIDNSNGNIDTEDFRSEDNCINWLRGKTTKQKFEDTDLVKKSKLVFATNFEVSRRGKIAEILKKYGIPYYIETRATDMNGNVLEYDAALFLPFGSSHSAIYRLIEKEE